MGEFHPLADVGVNDGVIAHHVATAHGVHADLGAGAFADDPLASMPHVAVVFEVAHFGEDLCQAFGGAARRVFFEPMVHFHHFEVEVRPEDFRRFAGEPEEGVHADAEVGREDNRDRFRGFVNCSNLGVGVAGGANDEPFPGLHTSVGDAFGEGVVAEVDDGVAAGQGGEEIIAVVDLRRDSHGGIVFHGSENGLAHAPFGTVDEKAKRVHMSFRLTSVARSLRVFSSLISQSGRRTSLVMLPCMASAVLIGTGLVSTKRSRKSGYQRS